MRRARQSLEPVVPAEPADIAKRNRVEIAPRQRYDRLSRFFHWSVAFGMIYTLIAGYALHLVADETAHNFLSVVNMSVGTVIAVLMVVRWLWSFFRPPVAPTDQVHSIQKNAAELAHSVIYAVTFAVLLSGFLMLDRDFKFFGLVEIPRLVQEEAVNHFFFKVHRASCMALVALLVLHVLAVLKHEKIDKSPILSRMT